MEEDEVDDEGGMSQPLPSEYFLDALAMDSSRSWDVLGGRADV